MALWQHSLLAGGEISKHHAKGGGPTEYFYCLFAKQLRDSRLPADVLVGELDKDISCALRRGTIARVTTALDAAQRAVEDELALDEAGWER